MVALAAPLPPVCCCSSFGRYVCSAGVVVSASGTAAQCGRRMRLFTISLNRRDQGFVYLCDSMPRRQTKRGEERTVLEIAEVIFSGGLEDLRDGTAGPA